MPRRVTHLEPWTSEEVLLAAARGDGCLGHCQSDEPVFVLCARDRLASSTVRMWLAFAREHNVSADKIADAQAICDAMDAWRMTHGGGKVPD